MLDLTGRGVTLRVAVDGATEATTQLAGVDHALQGTEASAKKASPAIDKVGASARLTAAQVQELNRQLVANGGHFEKVQLGASKVATAFGQLNNTHKDTIAMSDLVSGRLTLQTRAIETLYARVGGLGQQNSIFVRGLGSLGGALGLSTGATLGLLGAATLVIGVYKELGTLVVDSAKLFFEEAKGMRGARTELDSLTESWHDWQLVMGAVVLGQQSASITWFKLLEIGLDAVARRFTMALIEGEAFLAFVSRYSTMTMGVDITNPDPTATSANENFRLSTEQSVLALARQTHVTPVNPEFLSPIALALARRMNNGVPFTNLGDYLAAKNRADAQDIAAAKREQAAMSELTGTSILTDASTDMRRLSGLDINALPIASLQKVNDTLQAAIAIYRLRGQVAPAALQNEAFAVNQLLTSWELVTRAQARYDAQTAAADAEARAAFGDFAAHLPIAYKGTNGDFLLPSRDYSSNQTGIIKGFHGGVQPVSLQASEYGGNAQYPAPHISFFDLLAPRLLPDLGKTLERLLISRGSPGSALGATFGGDIFSTLMSKGSGTQQAIGGALSGMFGQKIGGLVGQFMPFGGQLLGSLVGSLFGKLFGKTDYQKQAEQANTNIAKMWSTANTQYGGQANTNQALTMFGFNPADLQGKNYQGAMGATALQGVFDQLSQKQAKFNTDLGDMLGKIHDLGGGLSAGIQPYLDKLKDGKILTQDNIDLIAKMGGDQTPTWQKMEEVAQKYNLTIAQLGPNFQNQKLHASFQDIIDDVDLLVRGGADVNTMLLTVGADGSSALTGLGTQVQSLVQQSQQFSIDIPGNMKPWIQKLIESGQLLGADGKAITDINKLKFGEDMQTTLQHLNDTLKQLIDALGVKLPEAIGRVPRSIDIDVNYRTHGLPGDTSGSGTGGSGGGTGGGTGGNTGTTTHYGGYIMHAGGIVPKRLHWGGLASDERPIIAQVGEYMIRRSSVQKYGIDTFKSFNNGTAAADGGQIVFHAGAIVLHGTDGPSIQRLVESKDFSVAVARVIKRNTHGLGTEIRQAVA